MGEGPGQFCFTLNGIAHPQLTGLETLHHGKKTSFKGITEKRPTHETS